jgi:hypothetical protein
MPDHLSPRPARRRSREADEQSALISWRDRFAPQEPRLRWLHSSLNGVHLTGTQARKAKATGMTAGVWDLFLPEPIRLRPNEREYLCCGLFIEMKSAAGKLSPEQIDFHWCHHPSYHLVVCRTWIEAALVICDYLGLPSDHPARAGLAAKEAAK